MVAFRRDLCKQFPHIMNLRCVLHTLNLVCQDVLKHPEITGAVKSISSMVVFFSNSHYWRQQLTQWGTNKQLKSFLSKYCETRWYTFVLMFECKCKEYEEDFKYVAEFLANRADHSSINQSIIELVQSDLFETVDFLITILKPLSDSIAILEQKTANISDVWKCFTSVNNFYKTNLNPDKLPSKYMSIGKFVSKRLNDRSISILIPT